MGICKVKNCYDKCRTGDKLFCPMHRAKWQNDLEYLGIHETILGRYTERQLLNMFTDGKDITEMDI